VFLLGGLSRSGRSRPLALSSRPIAFPRVPVRVLSQTRPSHDSVSIEPRKAPRPGKSSASTPNTQQLIAVVTVPSLAGARTAGMGGGSGHAQKKVRCRIPGARQRFSLLLVGLSVCLSVLLLLFAVARDADPSHGRSGPHAGLN
jgi:hypothetical protein